VTKRKPNSWTHPITGKPRTGELVHTHDYLQPGNDHLEIRSVKPRDAPHPLSATGYLSHCIDSDALKDSGGAVHFVTAWLARETNSQEPASGAGGMILAAADVLEAKGIDPRSALYVEALDVSSLCFKMTYLQLALRGIPAMVRHANTLSLENFESAHTPAFLPFLRQHAEAFRQWQQEARVAAPTPPSAGVQGDLFQEPETPSRHRSARKKPDPAP